MHLSIAQPTHAAACRSMFDSIERADTTEVHARCNKVILTPLFCTVQYLQRHQEKLVDLHSEILCMLAILDDPILLTYD